ncbi:FAD binding domain-containing protein, partial [Chloroflexota bacterium]
FKEEPHMSQLVKNLGFFPRVIKPFEYFEPETIEEATQVLAEHGERTRLIAGGVDLVPRMRRRLLVPEHVVSLRGIAGLDYIKGGGADGLKIGPLVTIRSLELSPAVKKDYTALYEAAHQLASVQVKVMGTAVGNLCVATPASDIAVALFALGAQLKIVGATSEKVIPIEEFFVGVGQTSLQPGEIVTEVLVPGTAKGSGSAFFKLVRTSADIAKVNAAVYLVIADGVCREARIALGSVAATTIRAKKAEAALKGKKIAPEITEEAAEAASEETKTITDLRSTAEYRQEMAGVLVKRAIGKALERAKA